MKILFTIIGIVLLLPIALVVVGLLIVTLIGGYIGIVVKLLGEALLVITVLIIIIKIIHFISNR